MFPFIHYLCRDLKRFDSVKLTYPSRGNLYMERDQIMGVIEQKNYSLEIPKDLNKGEIYI